MSKAITFLASLPAIQSAIKIDGSGGARVMLDVPESEMGNFIPVMMLRGKRLRVTIEEAQDEKKEVEYGGRLK